MEQLKQLVAKNKDAFFPESAKKEIRTIDPAIREWLSFADDARVDRDKNMTLANFMAKIDGDVQVYKQQMEQKIQAIAADKTIEKVPQFTQNAGSYMAEMAVVCAHNPDLLARIEGNTFPADSKAKERVSELKEKVEKIASIENIYSELDGLSKKNKHKFDDFPDGSKEQLLCAALDHLKDVFNFKQFNNIDLIKMQISEADYYLKHFTKLIPLDKPLPEKAHPIAHIARDVQVKLKQLRDALQEYQTSYGAAPATVTQYNAAVSSLAGANAELKDDLDRASGEVAALQGSNLEMKATVEELVAGSERIAQSLADATRANVAMKSELAALQGNFKERDTLISYFTAKFEDM